MKLQSKTLVALAVSGLLAGTTLAPLAYAGEHTDGDSHDHSEKDGCKGEGDKDSCKGHEEGDKDSCSGKDGCNSK